MDCLELNPAQDFPPWEEHYINELENLEFIENLGNMLLFEDDSVKLWKLKLDKGQRIPFLRHNKNFSWITETDALLKSRSANGRISLVRVEKGGTEYFEHSEKNYSNDLEILGKNPAVFKILEYKKEFLNFLPSLNC